MSHSPPSNKIATIWDNAKTTLRSIATWKDAEDEPCDLPEIDDNLAIALRLCADRIATQGTNMSDVFLKKGSSRSVKDLEYACLSFSGLENAVSLQKLQFNIRYVDIHSVAQCVLRIMEYHKELLTKVHVQLLSESISRIDGVLASNARESLREIVNTSLSRRKKDFLVCSTQSLSSSVQ